MILSIVIGIAIVALGFWLATRPVPRPVVTNPVGREITDNDPLEGIAAVGTTIKVPDFYKRFESLVVRGPLYKYIEKGSPP